MKRLVIVAVTILTLCGLFAQSGMARIPIVSHVDAYVIGDRLQYTAHFDAAINIFAPDKVGGWAFQLFLDTDQYWGSGYGNGPIGSEYLVRGIDSQPDGSLEMINTSDGTFGPSVGTVGFMSNSSLMRLDIPMAMLGFDNGYMNYRLEMYDVVSNPYDAASTTYMLGSYHDGRTTVIPEPTTALLMLAGLGGLALLRRQF